MIQAESKPAIKSMGILGGVIAILPSFWNEAIIPVTEFVVSHLPEISEGLLTVVSSGVLSPAAVKTVTAIGGVLAVLGRARAETPISGVFSSPEQ
jgi:hypothetical protein